MAKAADLTVSVGTALVDIVELIPRKVRTAVYVTAVVVALAAFAAQRVVAIWWPELDARVDATTADVVTGALFVIGVLGTAYRPTRADQLPIAEAVPVLSDREDAAHIQATRARTIQTLTDAGWDPDAAVEFAAGDNLDPLRTKRE